jgi:hypothetical protein
MTGLDRVVVLALGLATASGALGMRAASPGLQLLQAERALTAQRVRLLDRIVTNADRLDETLVPSEDRDRVVDARGSGELHQAVNDLRQAAAWLRDRASDRRPNGLALESVLHCGARISGLTQRSQLGIQSAQAWLSLRADLDRLARAHAIAWTWRTLPSTAPPAVTEDDP